MDNLTEKQFMELRDNYFSENGDGKSNVEDDKTDGKTDVEEEYGHYFNDDETLCKDNSVCMSDKSD